MKFSGFAQDKIFSNKSVTAATAIFEEFEALDELAAFIQKHGKSKDDVDSIVSNFLKAAKNSYRPPAVIADSVNQILAISVSTIRLLQGRSRNTTKSSKSNFQRFPIPSLP